ncbi:MAG: hypothetical protein KGH99_02840 [Thaumarchaeota archaeon]|nr:hypothetical protein [Nitrososphaerota archaeon]MDE1872397.1 hypothetical protein [Nitrososphaerota archaeon]
MKKQVDPEHMSGSRVAGGGYVCAPYLHNEFSSKLKESLERSEYIDDMYFVTATFSEDGNAYFPSHANTYLLARFRDQQLVLDEVNKYKQERPTFVFSRYDEFFERLTDQKLNLVSVYYLDYGHSESDLNDLAMIVVKRNRIRRVECGTLYISSTETAKFTFPYDNNLVVFEVSSDNMHQRDNKYCEKTRREVARKGIQLTNLLNLSIIEKIR